MRTLKVFIFLFVLLMVWMVAPAEAFVLNNSSKSIATDYSSVAGSLHYGDFYYQFEATPYQQSYPFVETQPSSFSSLPRAFGSHNRFHSKDSRIYGRADRLDGCNDLDLSPAETPEPATLLLFGAGLVGVGVYRRFKN